MIHRKMPGGFAPRFEVVSCYVECDGRILLLHRPEHKSQGGKWGVPAGKIEPGESQKEALLREVKEEAELVLDGGELDFLTTLHVTHAEYDFLYHMYRTIVSVLPEVCINPQEHQGYRWVEPREAISSLPLVTDLDECIRMFYE